MDYKKFFRWLYDPFHIKRECVKYGISLWQCPRFLFLIMGLIIIVSIISTYILTINYVDPLIVTLVILILTAVLFIISYIIVSSFEHVAEASRSKSEFISIVSHRLRTPLSAIKWQIDLLMSEKLKLDDQKAKVSLLEIQTQNEKMISIVNNLLDLNRIEDKNLILFPSSFSLLKVVEEVVGLQSAVASRANLMITIDAPENLPDVFADRMKIKNIVYHLLDNAIRYSSRKGKISISLETQENFVKFLISDEGVGISPKDAKKIFQKFFRGRDFINYQTEGTGIGLFVSKTIIEKSGGKMGFTSIEGRGSTFWFTLPISQRSNL
ncbi:MAG: HAMP domain-containing sensor histidine kinase [Candidatus Pacearchaeota archaeon]